VYLLEKKIKSIDDLMSIADLDPRHQTGEIIGSMTTSVHPRVFDVIAKFIEKNQNDHVLFPSLSAIEEELISETKRMLGLSEDIRGVITSGGTESNILALYAFKKTFSSRTVISLESAHQSISKAAALLELNIVKVKVNDDGYYNPDELQGMLARYPNSVLVLTMGTTEIGRVDPITPIIDSIRKYHIHVHIDGAMGGFTYPFTNPKEFSKYVELVNEGLASFSTDYHKFPGAPIPSSVLFISRILEDKLKWDSHYMPAGYQKGLLGTRPGYSAAGALATLLLKGRDGLAYSAIRSYNLALETMNTLKSKWNLSIPRPDVPLLCVGLGEKELVYRAWSFLWSYGIRTYFCSKPPGLRIVFMPHIKKKHIDRFIDKLLEFFEQGSREYHER
jgi:tyrosine decarboxylase/aspartate 1-decarboxylase